MQFTSDTELALVALMLLAAGGLLWLRKAWRSGRLRGDPVLVGLIAAAVVLAALLWAVLRRF